MKKINILFVLALCLSMLAACNDTSHPNPSAGNSETPWASGENMMPHSSGTEPKGQASAKQQTYFLTPEYNYSANELALLNLSTGSAVSSYSFDTAQTPILTERTAQGVFMLSSQGAADIQTTNGISIISGDSSAETLIYWQFDHKMNLLNRYELTDPELLNGLQGYLFAASPDGGEIIYAVGDCLYRYIFETQNLEKISLELDKIVYYSAIRYSASGNYLAFFGSFAGQDGTAYGSIDLGKKMGKAFSADHFSGTTLTVSGEYAAIADTVLPNSMGGPSKTGSVLFLDLAQQQGKKIPVESGQESGLVTVTADGRYVVTCMGGDGPSGVLRGYRISDGAKAVEQPYTMNVNCNPYMVLIREQSAYAALGTDGGAMLSPAAVLP